VNSLEGVDHAKNHYTGSVVMTRSNPLHRLEQLGQSVWLDYIERGFVTSGELATVIRENGVSGLTSNPAIFHKAITEHR